MRCARMMTMLALAAMLALGPASGQTDDFGYGDTAQQEYRELQRDLIYRLKYGMVEARDVSAGLSAWFAAKPLAAAGKYAEARATLRQGMTAMPGNPPALAQPTFGPLPTPAEVKLELLQSLTLSDDLWQVMGTQKVTGVTTRIARFQVGELTEYGVVMHPTAPGKYPVILYMHGAAFGLPSFFLPVLAQHAAMGYTIVAPAMRGEPLFTGTEYLAMSPEDMDAYMSEGRIENLVGEVDDGLAMVAGAQTLPMVKPGKFAVLGHSFGAGAGLLVATRTDQCAGVVSYDAWLTNPFRYYWDRLAGGANNWGSWEAYTEQPVDAQLAGLMRRSLVHQAARIQAPLLLFMGGSYNGSVFHESHDDLIRALRAADKPFRYEVIPGGGHNFVLYPDSEPAKTARAIHIPWLKKHLPPVPPPAAALAPEAP